LITLYWWKIIGNEFSFAFYYDVTKTNPIHYNRRITPKCIPS